MEAGRPRSDAEEEPVRWLGERRLRQTLEFVALPMELHSSLVENLKAKRALRETFLVSGETADNVILKAQAINRKL